MDKFFVSKEQAGLKLLDFLKSHLPEISKKELKKQIDANHCSINGSLERFANSLVWPGQEITFQKALKKKLEIFNIKDILFENEDLLIYNKPSGISSDEEGIIKLLKPYFSPLFLVHRLDKRTSGCIIIAKNNLSEKILLEAFQKQEVEKEYHALVTGKLKKDQGIIKNYWGKIKTLPGEVLYGIQKKGALAITEWQVWQKGSQTTLLKCFPKTGKTHQIRGHLATIGHPIIGDHQYGRAFLKKSLNNRLMLHAYQISFFYHLQKITAKAPWPADFDQVIKAEIIKN